MRVKDRVVGRNTKCSVRSVQRWWKTEETEGAKVSVLSGLAVPVS